MKKVFNFILIACFVVGLATLNGCKEDPEIPTLTTTAVTDITTTTATTGGNVTSDGGADVTARGVCWGTTTKPVVSGNHTTNGQGTGTFTSSLTGLEAGTTYFVRAYATNKVGTAYGNEISFPTTAIVGATVTTAAVTSITSNSAVSGGNVTADGGATVDAKGICWGTSENPSITSNLGMTNDGSGLGAFTSDITGLEAGTDYHVRAYATNISGTTYGTDVPFTTSAGAPEVTTASVTNILGSTATSGGNVTSTGGATITAKGVCWSTTPDPTISDNITNEGSGPGVFTSDLTKLAVYTTYYVRAYVTNSAGFTSYGNPVQFMTALADADGNIYGVVTIGSKVWMLENLKTTKYNDTTNIPKVAVAATWMGLTTPGYCWYESDSITNKPLYGAIYNWFVVDPVSNGNKNVCPVGWHVPTDADFQTLETTLGMTAEQVNAFNWRGTDEGAKLKSNQGWLEDGNGTNSSGFTALPGGYRYYDDGNFLGKGTIGYFWSSSEDGQERAFMRQLDSAHTTVERTNADKNAGKSIRCVKD